MQELPASLAWAVCQNVTSIYHTVVLGAQQNDVNARIVLPGTHHSTRHMLHAFEIWTPTSTYCQLLICMFFCFFISYQARFCLQMSYPAILFIYNADGIFLNPGNSCLSAGDTQSVHIVSFPAGSTRSCPSTRYMMIPLTHSERRPQNIYS